MPRVIRDPCSFGMRLAVPLADVSVDDVRALVDDVHAYVGAEAPQDDFFLNLLGTAFRRGRKVVVLGAYKIRSVHADALQNARPGLQQLAMSVEELPPRAGLKQCVDLTTEEVRGGVWHWSDRSENVSQWEAMAQENRTWEHLGAAPRDISDDLARLASAVQELENTHGGADPVAWRWGPGTGLADVFEADDATRKHRDLKEQLATASRYQRVR